jgi:hypothetical protein
MCCVGLPPPAPTGFSSTSRAWCSISTSRSGARFNRPIGFLARELPGLKIMLATYFDDIGDNLDTALSLPVAGLHLDLVRAPQQLDVVATKAPPECPIARRHRWS